MNIYPDPEGLHTGEGWGRPFSNAHIPQSKTHTYNVIHSGALQKFKNILELSIYKWFNSN
jgi:hypothetical protein